MQSNKTCQLVEQYLGYLNVIKERSENTIKEYRTDLLMFLNFVMRRVIHLFYMLIFQ
ncbi:site-specific integrase [Desulfosporosinus sp. Sb-LF]|uniref:site-specific integrase n=1 Tax=Desulfosporosinus sp. Sb-LF TaxID=2560027 RepID=UPI001FB16837|nr:site-specific integrase [Desulfosporosinus sp. Sb-LF]